MAEIPLPPDKFIRPLLLLDTDTPESDTTDTKPQRPETESPVDKLTEPLVDNEMLPLSASADAVARSKLPLLDAPTPELIMN